MKGLKIEDYDCVEDIIVEALDTLCGITDIREGLEELERDVEYVCGAINVVKLGDKPNTLKHKREDGWSEDVDQTDTNYMYATYYRRDQLQKLVENHLTRKHYYNNFLTLD